MNNYIHSTCKNYQPCYHLTGFKINHTKIHKQCCVKGTYHRQLVNSSPKITVRHEEACKSSTNIIYQWNVGFVATKLINV